MTHAPHAAETTAPLLEVHGDMPPPDPAASTPAVPYDEPRGRCPRCRSSAVTHRVGGLLPGPLTGPAWVVAVGCCLPVHDRACEDCGLEWGAHEDRGR